MLGIFSIGDEVHKVGDRVFHYREIDRVGTITEVAENDLSVMVQWDDCDASDFQWSNKVVKLFGK